VTGALLPHGINIEDSRMAILRGHFAMMLVVAVPEDADPASGSI
jgi:predicted amino acid-binding ACT domain protein